MSRAGADQSDRALPKAATGIEGLDEITGGGLPRGRPTLICGSAGCGKTLMAMEFLVRGASEHGEPGVFVTFEELPSELTENVRSLGFDLQDLENRGLLLLEHIHVERSEIEETGEYDLEGLFIRLGFAIDSIGAKRIVLDTLEVLFGGLPNEAILRSELRRLPRRVGQGLMRNPILVALLSGLAFHALGLALPQAVDRWARLIGEAAGPCALFSMGASLRAYRIGGAMSRAAVMMALKLLLLPLLVWLLATRVFTVDPAWLGVAVITAAMPCGVNSYLFAERATLRKRGVETREVADVVLFLLSPLSSGVNAQGVVVDAGMGCNFFDTEIVRRAVGDGEGSK